VISLFTDSFKSFLISWVSIAFKVRSVVVIGFCWQVLIIGICENIPILEYPIDNFKRVHQIHQIESDFF